MDMPSLTSSRRLKFTSTSYCESKGVVFHHFKISSDERTLDIELVDRFKNIRELYLKLKMLNSS